MELKDMILSTLAELDTEEESEEEQVLTVKEESKTTIKKEVKPQEPQRYEEEEIEEDEEETNPTKDELAFLSNVRERILVLFEGFQSPNNKNLDAKIDLSLNFLEYLLATIDDRMDKIKS